MHGATVIATCRGVNEGVERVLAQTLRCRRIGRAAACATAMGRTTTARS